MNAELTARQKDRGIFAGSLLVFLDFFSMTILGSYRIRFPFIGVLIELATIPMFLLLVALPVLCVTSMIRRRPSLYLFLSFLQLTAALLRLIFVK